MWDSKNHKIKIDDFMSMLEYYSVLFANFSVMKTISIFFFLYSIPISLSYTFTIFIEDLMKYREEEEEAFHKTIIRYNVYIELRSLHFPSQLFSKTSQQFSSVHFASLQFSSVQ